MPVQTGAINVNNIKPMRDCVLVSELYESWNNERVLNSGVILAADTFKASSLKARFCKVFAVGDDIDWLEKDQWILVEHGRWTEKISVELDGENRYINKVDPEAILAVWEGEGIPVNDYVGRND